VTALSYIDKCIKHELIQTQFSLDTPSKSSMKHIYPFVYAQMQC